MTTTSINPATGLPINDADNGNCVDIGGNVFGTDNSDFSDTTSCDSFSVFDDTDWGGDISCGGIDEF